MINAATAYRLATGDEGNRRRLRNAGMALGLSFVLFAAVPAVLAQGASPQAQAPAAPWPRDVQLSGAVVTIYQPQVEKWEGDTLKFRAAVAAKPGRGNETFGVIWGEAHTEVDRVARMVTLSGVSLTQIKFPTLDDNGSAYLRELRRQLPSAARTIELDRLQASLAANAAVRPSGVLVRNDVPRIIVSTTPAVLVPIAGDPVLKKAADARFERVLNTRALILRDASTYYLHLYDGWMSAPALDGPWRLFSEFAPLGMETLAANLAKNGQVDLLDGGNAQPKPSLTNGAPTVYVSQTPAELIVFNGRPDLQPVSGTGLLWATNTIADVIVDTASNEYYVLVSGRWYRARSLEGPWAFAASNTLPADFARIPANEPAARVLASVAGTPQAQEALIGNLIPQTAAVPRANGPRFTPTFDGAPQLRPVEGTPLQYVVNSPDAILQVDENSYYAVQNGIWFAATRLTGPWGVADAVPAVVYTIPTSSPLHYVTYVQVYRATPTTVYVGYTQGYLGTVVAPDGVVVYGTGYAYSPWVGAAYYGVPVTYGVAAYPAYDVAAGMMFGFAFGAAMAAPYWGPYYGGGCCWGASASQNVYGHWGNSVVSGTRTYGYNPATGNVGVRGSYTATNTRTGTVSNVQTARGYNPYTGERGAGYERSAVNPNTGASGTVERGAAYNPQTGTVTRGSAGTVSAPEAGVSASGQREVSTTASGQRSSESSGTLTDTRTGQSASYRTASSGNDHYADVNGNVYRNTGSGWQKNTSSGWENARSEESSSVAREQQARSEGEQRAQSYNRSANEDRFNEGRFRGGGGRGRR